MPRGKASPSAPVEEVYDINKLLKYECRNGKDFYLVEWKGYSPDEATWEPSENFIDPGPEIQSRMAELKKAHRKGESKRKSKSSATAHPEKQTAVSSEEDDNAAAAAAADSLSNHSAAPEEKDNGIDDARAELLRNITNFDGSSAAKRPRHELRDSSIPCLRQLPIEPVPMPPNSMFLPPRPSPLIADAAPPGYNHVRSVRQDTGRGICAIMTRSPGDEDVGYKVPLDSVRQSHPQALIDFLVARIQFRNRL